MNDLSKREAKKYSDAILKLTAIYCNDIQYHMTNLGARLTFGEQSLVQGEPPHHHVAVFIPYPVIAPFLETFTKAWQEHRLKNKQAAEAAQKTQDALDGKRVVDRPN